MRTRYCLTFVALIALAVPLLAEEKEPARQPVEYYELTPAGLEKYEKTIANFEKVAAALRAAGREQGDERVEDDSPDAFLDAIAEICEKVDPFRSSVEAAELTCREYALFNITVMQASMLSHGYEARGEEFLESFPGGKSKTVRANLQFAKEKKDAIRKLAERQQKVFSPEE